MAEKVQSSEEDQAKNTIDPDRLKKEIGRIEEALEAKQSHKMRYVESCKPINERVANAYEIASKAAGVPMKVLKATIKQRELQRKIEGIPEKFEEETRETFDMVCQALGDFGDTPLGGAAKAKAAKAEGRESPPVDDTETKRPRGRPRKAPSPDAAAAAQGDAGSEPKAAEAASAAASASAAPADVAGLDPRAVAETDDPTYQRGFKAGQAGGGCVIPGELSGLYRDRWHAGWIAGRAEPRTDADREQAIADARAAEENASRLRAGISPLH